MWRVLSGRISEELSKNTSQGFSYTLNVEPTSAQRFCATLASVMG
jgi:hypothetical protein